ncbi:MAG: hypothetical protein IPP07_29470 [Holophagales bacterium]|nr:hypothetical protein [Holophagales bacterium]
MSASPRPRPILYWRVSPANEGLVFATPERAEEVDALYRAITTSRTWGAFRAAMPPEEYEQIVSIVFDEAGEERPEPGTPFDSSVVPGYCDGDYPPWLQTEMEEVLPQKVIDRYGRWVETSINGWYVHLEASLDARSSRCSRAPASR